MQALAHAVEDAETEHEPPTVPDEEQDALTREVAPLVHEKLEVLADFIPMAGWFFRPLEFSPEALERLQGTAGAAETLSAAAAGLRDLPEWDVPAIETLVRELPQALAAQAQGRLRRSPPRHERPDRHARPLREPLGARPRQRRRAPRAGGRAARLTGAVAGGGRPGAGARPRPCRRSFAVRGPDGVLQYLPRVVGVGSLTEPEEQRAHAALALDPVDLQPVIGDQPRLWPLLVVAHVESGEPRPVRVRLAVVLALAHTSRVGVTTTAWVIVFASAPAIFIKSPALPARRDTVSQQTSACASTGPISCSWMVARSVSRRSALSPIVGHTRVSRSHCCFMAALRVDARRSEDARSALTGQRSAPSAVNAPVLTPCGEQPRYRSSAREHGSGVSDMTEMKGPVYVVGAAGHQGGAALDHLRALGVEAHALFGARDATPRPRPALGRAGDRLRPTSTSRRRSSAPCVARARSSSCSKTPTPGRRSGLRHGQNLIDSAVAAGVGHIVFAAATGPDHHRLSCDVSSEIARHLERSRVPVTVLRPATFMEEVPWYWLNRYGRELVLTTPFVATAHLPLVALDDVGALAALAVTRPDEFAGRTIDVAGDTRTPLDIAGSLAVGLGEPVRYEEVQVEGVFVYQEASTQVHDIEGLRGLYPSLHTFPSWLDAGGGLALCRSEVGAAPRGARRAA